MALMTWVNLMSVRAYGEFEFWFSSIKVAAIISFIVFVGAYACGYRSPSGPTFSNLVAYGGFAPQGAFAVLASVVTVIWSMMGSEVVTIAAAESPEPARAVARMTSTIISRILMFYVGSVFVIVSTVPWTRVVARQSWRCAALAGADQPPPGARAGGAARGRGGIRGRDRRDPLAERGLRFPRECLRSDHCSDLSRDRRVAGAVATRAGKGRRTRAGAADVAVSVAELPGDRGDGAGADRDGADALAARAREGWLSHESERGKACDDRDNERGARGVRDQRLRA